MKFEEMKEILNDPKDKMDKIEKINDGLEEGLNGSCKINITYDKGAMKLETEGTKLTILIAVASAEKQILSNLDCSEEKFNFFKKAIGHEEVTE